MTAGELRIGNLVYVDWVDSGRKTETNYGVHYQNISKPCMVMDTCPTGYGCNLDFVKPIKLDYKELRALGFVFIEDPKQEWILNGVHIVLYADGFYYLCVHDCVFNLD